MATRNKAFTIAEVLITLTIVGIVAAIVIPSLKNYSFERTTVSKVKKTYATLSEAIKSWEADAGCAGDGATCPFVDPLGSPHQGQNITKAVAEYLKPIEAVYAPANTSGIDWLPDKAYVLNGNISTLNAIYTYSPVIDRNKDTSQYSGFLLLPDGTVVAGIGTWYHFNFVFDINGKKGPNRLGKDQFTMSLYTDNHKDVSPYASKLLSNTSSGSCVDTSTNICTPDGSAATGYSPLAYILTYDKLPDLTKWGYPANP